MYAWNTQPRALRSLLEAARRACPTPLIVKLSPDFAEANEAEIIPAVLEAGIRIVNYGNTRRVDDPRLSQRTGGLSGPDLFPATLANLRRTRARFGDALEIIATGGVDAPDKALALLRAGATAVSYFTGFVTRGPILARQILEALLDARWSAMTEDELPDSPAAFCAARSTAGPRVRTGRAAWRHSFAPYRGER